MLPTKVNFTRDFLNDGDLTDLTLSIVKAMIDSRRFYLSTRGVLQFQPNPHLPSDLVGITRVPELESILRSGLVIKLTGEALSKEEMKALCMSIQDHRWRIPSVSTAPQFAPVVGVNS